jgi:shikimate dehydrogenase
MTGVPYAEVIGDPVEHSKSPQIHKFWLEKLGAKGDYRATRVTKEGLLAYLEARFIDPDWRGCNVTMPHKQHLYSLIGDSTGGAIEAKVYNCVTPKGGRLTGANTDSEGFIEPLLSMRLKAGLAVVIGAGGVARTAASLLARQGFEIEVHARDPLKAVAMLDELGIEGKTGRIDDPIPPAALLVNASPLGMTGFPDFPWNLDHLPGDAIVYDMVYEPVVTGLIAKARVRGLRTIDGLGMLIGQAAGAFHIFFGYKAPREYDAELYRLLIA